MTERVGFSQEVVNAFMTITANGECIFSSKLKINLKKLFYLHSVLRQEVILSDFMHMCLSKLCVQDRQQTGKSPGLCILCISLLQR